MTSTEAVIKNPAAEGTTSAFSLIFELEGAAIDGHTVLFEAAKSVFQKAGITLTDLQVARYCTHGAIPQIIQKLVDELGQGKLGADAANQILAAYHDGFKNAGRVHPLFASFLKETSRRGIRATAISILPEEIAQQVLASSGLADQGVDLHVFVEAERHFPRVDCWMKVVRQVAKSPRACIAIAGCRDSGKSALSSGMRCVIIPDRFTSHQDFSGADAVLESAEDYSLTELIDQLT
jgi:putative hydrolase of the HAD superfamily